ncbi:NAD(P)/FAD-dependent oxidoreductase [Bartonella sp. HY406]|uniref:NAD(P)/FAD-dependent oxidoreductase n=1 Tax=Bartonella sp. HY406 TaxID=2979331 RepID=UPI0021C953CD|nr:FAD-binding oxidoreductase [Bartonella sp. HY406]UXN03097.1 FAD-binding oxidoreductase [Bartonella sp. HY406]
MQQDAMSPGISWYAQSVDDRPRYPILQGDHQCDVAIIGGGFTGLSAACHLAENNVSTIVIDARRFGAGASGRNGGQFGTGQRRWVEDLEKQYGFERAKALFDLAEEAKPHIHNFASKHNFEIDYLPGQLSVAHKPRYLDDYKSHVDNMARYGYNHLQFMDKNETSERLGSSHYYGGIRDMGTGHIHPLKLVIGTANTAHNNGAALYERTTALSVTRNGTNIIIKTEQGTISAKRVLIATNGYGGKINNKAQAHVLPIRSFIGSTVPLSDNTSILPSFEAVDDSRFVVRYFRKTPDNRLLFGGSEAYGNPDGRDMTASVRKQLTQIYPDLKDIELTHVWGGTVAITVERMPYVREVEPGITFCGGYSGHGVMLSHYFGYLYAQAILGKKDRLDIMRELKISGFPGGALRSALLYLGLSWFALLDRL